LLRHRQGTAQTISKREDSSASNDIQFFGPQSLAFGGSDSIYFEIEFCGVNEAFNMDALQDIHVGIRGTKGHSNAVWTVTWDMESHQNRSHYIFIEMAVCSHLPLLCDAATPDTHCTSFQVLRIFGLYWALQSTSTVALAPIVVPVVTCMFAGHWLRSKLRTTRSSNAGLQYLMCSERLNQSNQGTIMLYYTLPIQSQNQRSTGRSYLFTKAIDQKSTSKMAMYSSRT
jgi:hypothetical protein